MSDFDMMDLPKHLVKRLSELGIKDPTPIQKQAIPHALNGRDVMGLAPVSYTHLTLPTIYAV